MLRSSSHCGGKSCRYGFKLWSTSAEVLSPCAHSQCRSRQASFQRHAEAAGPRTCPQSRAGPCCCPRRRPSHGSCWRDSLSWTLPQTCPAGVERMQSQTAASHRHRYAWHNNKVRTSCRYLGHAEQVLPDLASDLLRDALRCSMRIQGAPSQASATDWDVPWVTLPHQKLLRQRAAARRAIPYEPATGWGEPAGPAA